MTSERSGYGVSLGTVRITDLGFADDAVVFAETTQALAEALVSLSEEAELLELRFSWIETNVESFGDILHAIIQTIPVNSENVEIT